MPYEVPVTLEWQRTDPAATGAPVTVETGLRRVEVRGRVSLGGAGWRLTASALKRRRELRLTLTAAQEALPAAIHPGLEELQYIVVLPDVQPGRYALVVTHRSQLAVEQHAAESSVAFSGVIVVPGDAEEPPGAPPTRLRGQLRARRRLDAAGGRGMARDRRPGDLLPE